MPQYSMIILVILTLVYLANPNQEYKIPNHSSSELQYNSTLSLISVDSVSKEPIPGDARVYKTNNKIQDLGTLNQNGGSLVTYPQYTYRVYFNMDRQGPSEEYYVNIVDYDVKENKTELVSDSCRIASSLDFSVKYNGRPVHSSDPLSLDSYQTKTIDLTISTSPGECYGMPKSKQQNALCFVYDGLVFSSIDINSVDIAPPYSIKTEYNGNKLSCFNSPKISQGSSITVPVTITSSNVNPNRQDILVVSEDTAFDIKTLSFGEIFNYQDEYNNNLGARMAELGVVYIG